MPKITGPIAIYRNQDGKNVVKRFRTYAKLRRAMLAMMNDSINDEISVYRSRRGQIGEWFEHWERHNHTNKIEIVKQGWQ